MKGLIPSPRDYTSQPLLRGTGVVAWLPLARCVAHRRSALDRIQQAEGPNCANATLVRLRSVYQSNSVPRRCLIWSAM